MENKYGHPRRGRERQWRFEFSSGLAQVPLAVIELSMDRDKRATEIAKSIGQILLNDWDPIGVRQVPEAQDEYEGYIGEVYRLLSSGASVEDVCRHLANIEEKSMGLGTSNSKSLEAVAIKLINLNVRL